MIDKLHGCFELSKTNQHPGSPAPFHLNLTKSQNSSSLIFVSIQIGHVDDFLRPLRKSFVLIPQTRCPSDHF